MIQHEESEIYSDDDEFFYSDYEDLGSEEISDADDHGTHGHKRYATHKINQERVKESESEEKEEYEEETKDEHDGVSATTYSDFDEYSEGEHDERNDSVPYNNSGTANFQTHSAPLPVPAMPCHCCCDPRYEFLKKKFCRPINRPQEVISDKRPRKFSIRNDNCSKFGNPKKNEMKLATMTKAQNKDRMKLKQKNQKRAVLSQERMNELSRPRTAPERSNAQKQNQAEKSNLKSRALGIDEIIRFTNRMDNRQRSRQKKIERRIQEKIYQDQTNKKTCPVCGNFQSYNEVINKREECPNERCLGAKYVRNRPFSLKKFEERMKRSVENREKRVALLQEEQENARRNEMTFRKSQTQKKLDESLSRRGPFLTRMENDLKSRQRKIMNRNNAGSTSQTTNKKFKHRNCDGARSREEEKCDQNYRPVTRSREEEKCGY